MEISAAPLQQVQVMGYHVKSTNKFLTPKQIIEEKQKVGRQYGELLRLVNLIDGEKLSFTFESYMSMPSKLVDYIFLALATKQELRDQRREDNKRFLASSPPRIHG